MSSLKRAVSMMFNSREDRWALKTLSFCMEKYDKHIIAKVSKYVKLILSTLDHHDANVRRNTLRILASLEPQVLAKYAPSVIPRLVDEHTEVSRVALLTLQKLPLVALVPHRFALRCARTDAVAPLMGRVWLVRWRQLFWVQRLLWWWASRAWVPGSAQAGALADEFGCMQEGRQKRARL